MLHHVALPDNSGDAIAARYYNDNLQYCTIGYLSRSHFSKRFNLDGKSVQVIKLLEDSPNTTYREYNHKNCGVAFASLVE